MSLTWQETDKQQMTYIVCSRFVSDLDGNDPMKPRRCWLMLGKGGRIRITTSTLRRKDRAPPSVTSCDNRHVIMSYCHRNQGSQLSSGGSTGGGAGGILHDDNNNTITMTTTVLSQGHNYAHSDMQRALNVWAHKSIRTQNCYL